jgi:mono/diheme cytochrome c family protein
MRLPENTRKYFKGFPVFLGAIGLATAVAVASTGTAHGATMSDHDQAVGALSDIQSAINMITNAEAATTSGPASYKNPAQSAINALVGAQDAAFSSDAPNPGDAQGAIGHINQLLDRDNAPPWVPDLHGVLVNAQAAVGSLQDAMAAKDLDAYEVSASEALANLELAEGRPSEYGALGGMVGALANTELAVTNASIVVNGCTAPQHAGFGVYQGYLAYRAIPVSALSQSGIDNPGGSTIKRNAGMILFYSAAAPLVEKLCTAQHAQADAPILSPVLSPVLSPSKAMFRSLASRPTTSPLLIEAADAPSGGAGLYTMAQAKAGAAIYTSTCAACHGGNLQGVSAPAIAGAEFQKTAVSNKYTVSIIRTIVTQNMPLSNPGSLTDPQYAQIMAYLLAENCYPAGAKPFPTDDTPALAKVTMGPPAKPRATPDANGVCAVQ